MIQLLDHFVAMTIRVIGKQATEMCMNEYFHGCSL